MYGQLGYFAENPDEDLSVDEFNELPFLEPMDHFTQYAPRLGKGEITFPKFLTKLLDIYYSFEKTKKDYFTSACTLFVDGLELKDNHLTFSLAVIAFITTIETLIAYENIDVPRKSCKECNRPIYSVYQKFLDFYEKYTGRKENRKFARYLYKLRSGIAHGGKLFASDKQSGFELMDSVKLENIIKNVRVCLVNWLAMSS